MNCNFCNRKEIEPFKINNEIWNFESELEHGIMYYRICFSCKEEIKISLDTAINNIKERHKHDVPALPLR